MGDRRECYRDRTDCFPVLFDQTTTEVWMVSVVTTALFPNHYEGFSRDIWVSLSKNQAQSESPLAVPSGVVGKSNCPNK